MQQGEVGKPAGGDSSHCLQEAQKNTGSHTELKMKQEELTESTKWWPLAI